MMRMYRSIIVSIALLALTTSSAYAATISLSPATVSVAKGQTFTISISVDSAGAKLYTVKAALSYPADMLDASSFAFADGTPMWIPLSQSGYDSMGNGTVI